MTNQPPRIDGSQLPSFDAVPPHLQRQPTFELLHRCPRDCPTKNYQINMETSQTDNPFQSMGANCFGIQSLQRTIWPRQSQYSNLSRQEPRIRSSPPVVFAPQNQMLSSWDLLFRCLGTLQVGCFPNGSTLKWIVSKCPFSDLHTSFNGTQKHIFGDTTHSWNQLNMLYSEALLFNKFQLEKPLQTNNTTP